MSSAKAEVLAREKQSRDILVVRKDLCRITGDLAAGTVLSHILYWYLPDDKGRDKLRIKKDNEFWICKSYPEWEEELFLSTKQMRRILKTLEDEQLITIKKFKFNGAPTNHLKVNWEVLKNKQDADLGIVVDGLEDEKSVDEVVGADGMLPLGTFQCDQRARSITKTTTKTTSEKEEELRSPNLDLPSKKELTGFDNAYEVLFHPCLKFTIDAPLKEYWHEKLTGITADWFDITIAQFISQFFYSTYITNMQEICKEENYGVLLMKFDTNFKQIYGNYTEAFQKILIAFENYFLEHDIEPMNLEYFKLQYAEMHNNSHDYKYHPIKPLLSLIESVVKDEHLNTFCDGLYLDLAQSLSKTVLINLDRSCPLIQNN